MPIQVISVSKNDFFTYTIFDMIQKTESELLTKLFPDYSLSISLDKSEKNLRKLINDF
jgi:hypothetical protein